MKIIRVLEMVCPGQQRVLQSLAQYSPISTVLCQGQLVVVRVRLK